MVEFYKKLAIVGEVGAGKTQLINTISEISPFATEEKSSVAIGKEYTTVGIDYGRLSIEENMALGLFGLPGQKRYSFLWDMVKENLWGLLVLVKYNKDYKIEAFENIINHFKPQETGIPLIIGLSHCDQVHNSNTDVLTAFLELSLSNFGLEDTPIMSVDPREAESCLMLLQLFNHLNDDLLYFEGYR